MDKDHLAAASHGSPGESDRELLTLAAIAAGIGVIRTRLHDPICLDILINNSPRNIDQASGPWNPLTDDGDALRLAVELRIEIGFSGNGMQAWAVQPYKGVREREHIAINADLAAATRRAIVRAAAAIGRSAAASPDGTAK